MHNFRTVRILTGVAWLFAARSVGATESCPLAAVGSVSFDGAAADTDDATAVAVDGAGHVVVVGWERINVSVDRARIRVYDATLGTLLATTSYTAPGDKWNRFQGVVVDPAGNITVVGFQDTASNQLDWVVRRYNASLTTLLGSTSYDGSAHGQDQAWGVGQDGSGNVYVAGQEFSGADNNWRIRKYDAGLTTLMATTDYNSSVAGDDQATAVAVDGSGIVAVAGQRYDPVVNTVWMVRRYNASLSADLGATDYANPGGNTSAQAVVLDPSGNVIVGGRETAGGLTNARIIKYSAGLSTQLGATAYRDGAGSYEDVQGLALTGAGHIVAGGVVAGGAAFSDLRRWNAVLTLELGATTYQGPGAVSAGSGVRAVALDGTGRLVAAGFEDGAGNTEDWRIRRYDLGTCTGVARLSPVVSVDAPGQAGSTLTVHIAVSNIGDVAADNVTGSLWRFSAGSEGGNFQAFTQDGGSWGTGSLLRTAGPAILGPAGMPSATATSLAPGGTAVFTLTYAVTGGGRVHFDVPYASGRDAQDAEDLGIYGAAGLDVDVATVDAALDRNLPPAGTMQVRQPVVRIKEGTKAYVLARVKPGGGDQHVKFLLYSRAGLPLGELARAVPVDASGVARLIFDGWLNSKPLATGIYWIVTADGLVSRRQVMVVHEP